MAEPHNNSISVDTIETRLYRLLRMQNNIDTYAVELGVSGALLAWAQACYDRFSGSVTSSGIEDGESKDATIVLHDLWATFGDYYQQAKDILKAKLAMFKPDEHLLASYGVDKRTPETYNDLITAANEMIAKHAELALAGDERIIAQAIIDQLTIHRDNFRAQVETAGIERRESDEAFNLQHTYFDEDTENLRYIFTIAKLIWGDDDPKLKDLGFVPSSEVWTPGSGEPEPGGDETEWGMVQALEVWIDPIGNIVIRWKKVATAETYKLLREVVPIGSPAPVLPYSVYKTGIPPLEEYVAYGDVDHDPGFAYYYSAIAVNAAGEETEPCPPKGVDYM